MVKRICEIHSAEMEGLVKFSSENRNFPMFHDDVDNANTFHHEGI